MKRIAFVILIFLSFGCEGDDMQNFFSNIDAAKAGFEGTVKPSLTLGYRGEPKGFINISVPNQYASSILVSCRSEYAVAQGDPMMILNATNAAPIVITTAGNHGLQTGQEVTIVGVTGNLAANGVWVVTFTGFNTISLNGSVGSGAYTGGGTLTARSIGLVGFPLVGILHWGTGGAYNEVEFDIPGPKLPNVLAPLIPGIGYVQQNQPMINTGNGVQMNISASSVKLDVRNDGYIAPANNPNNYVGNPSPAKVLCFISPGAASGAERVQRTIYLVGGNSPTLPGIPLVPGPPAGVLVSVPPFAKSVSFFQSNVGFNSMPLQLWFFANNLGVIYRVRDMAVNEEGPIELDRNTDQIWITNRGAANIDYLAAVFDVTPT